jgi:hypothetical protein
MEVSGQLHTLLDRRLSGPQNQSGRRLGKRLLYYRDSNSDPLTVQPVAKTYWGMEVYLQHALTSARDVGEWSSSRSGHLTAPVPTRQRTGLSRVGNRIRIRRPFSPHFDTTAAELPGFFLPLLVSGSYLL